MILIVLLLLGAIAVGIYVSRKRSRSVPPSVGETVAPSRTGEIPPYVEALLSRWTNAHVVSEEQADAIRMFERRSIDVEEPRHGRSSRMPAIAEAIGYVGGTLGLIGIVILLVEFWNDFSDAVRLGVPLVGAIGFVVAGAIVPEGRSIAMLRLRTVLWLLGTATVGIAAWVLTDTVIDVESIRRQWLVAALGVAIVGFALWAGRTRPVQQFVGIAGFTTAVGTAVGEFGSTGISGIAVWIVGLVLVALSMRRSGVSASVNVLTGSLALVVGAYLTVVDWTGPGLVFVLMSAVGLIGPVSIRRIDLPTSNSWFMGIVGLLALLQGGPACVVHFAAEAGLVTGLIVWFIGVGVLLVVDKGFARSDFICALVAGGLIVGGSAVTGAQSVGFATPFGLAISFALIALGTRPGRALMSVFGLIGLVVFIPWGISHFFPGEGRVPLMIIVSGLVLIGAAAGLSRLGGRLRGEIRQQI